MHMADALLSPAVGGTLWAATAAGVAYSARTVRRADDEGRIPLMGVVGAFVFAAQMINFTIPGTGSSGHLGGGLLLAVLLGPHAAFLVMASVLAVQALFFADGGLLALGANIFNLGVFPCFVAYPLIYRPLAGRVASGRRIAVGAVAASVVSLQLGALGVVLETVVSGISELPFSSFAALMLPIHLAIGLVEGVVTAAVVAFLWKAQPELVTPTPHRDSGRRQRGKVLAGLGAAALVTGVSLSWFASTRPDGLEWSVARVAGSEELPSREGGIHGLLARVQETLAVLPDYGFRASQDREGGEAAGEPPAAWPAVDPGTSASGLVGGLLTLLVAVGVGWGVRRWGTGRGRSGAP
ncbi:MAG: energy-coupling factor ABC transporter permease [Deferrisomatales bacterium]